MLCVAMKIVIVCVNFYQVSYRIGLGLFFHNTSRNCSFPASGTMFTVFCFVFVVKAATFTGN